MIKRGSAKIKKAVKKIKSVISSVGRKPVRTMTEEEMFPLVQKRAMDLWIEAGRPCGNDWEFWFRAEKEIKQEVRIRN